MAAEIRGAFPDLAVEVELIESSNGAFEVTVDGVRIFSKLESGRFPGYREIPNLIVEKL